MKVILPGGMRTRKGKGAAYRKSTRKCSDCGLELLVKHYFIGDETVCRFCRPNHPNGDKS